ncbi:MAG: hypothetical protein ACKVVT_17785 [Dehalococcoidia bacterium]
MEFSKAEVRYVRDGWRQFLYRACPELKANRQFTRELLDRLVAYNSEFLTAFVGEPSAIDAARPASPPSLRTPSTAAR